MEKFQKLSRAEMRNVMAGRAKPLDNGTCTESCGSGDDITSCSSASGDCSRDQYNNTITCDSKKYDCPIT